MAFNFIPESISYSVMFQGENNVLRNKLGLPVDTSVPFKPLDDVDELKEENKRLESKCEAAKKVGYPGLLSQHWFR